MIIVEPVQLLLCHQFWLNHLGLDWCHRHRLECDELTLARHLELGLCPHHLHQGLNADTKVAIFIVSRFIRQYHTRLQINQSEMIIILCQPIRREYLPGDQDHWDTLSRRCHRVPREHWGMIPPHDQSHADSPDQPVNQSEISIVLCQPIRD